MPQTREGGCQCGAVRYRITGEATALFACHCSHCQRQSGSAFGLSMRLSADQFELIKGELKGFAGPAMIGSSPVRSALIAARAFITCPRGVPIKSA